MDKIFDQAKDKNVAALVIYGKGSDGKAYADAAGTTQLKTSALENAFMKRALIKLGDVYYVPVSFTVDTKIGKVTYAVTTGSSDSAKTELKTLAAVAD
mgnify:CR=1 FL=1